MADTLDFYKDCIKSLLMDYELVKTEWSASELIFDDDRMRYLVMRLGWFQGRRIHQCVIHIDICEDTIIIHANNTENLVDEALIAKGILPEKIQLGFIPSETPSYYVKQEDQKRLEAA